MSNKNNMSLQEWLPFDGIFERGIVRLKTKEYIKIMKVNPINYNLKSDLEKKGILNSYKTFLKICNFDIQILIQSNKVDLTNHISKIQEKIIREKNEELKIISEKYISFINKINKEKNLSSKNFYIIIKNKEQNSNEEGIEIAKLNENYLKIKEGLGRCGNSVFEINQKKELEKIMFSFFNTRKNLMQ